MTFYPFDLKTWYRKQLFYYFSEIAPTNYSLTVKLDVTDFKSTVKKHRLRLFPSYLWLVTKNLNRFPEFTTAQKDGATGYYDSLTPLYANFHRDNHSFSFMWTEYSDSFRKFYDDFCANEEKYGENHGVLCNPSAPPENAYTVSCAPWIDFEHFSVQSDSKRPYFFPSVESGKITEDKGKLIMPLSLTCHHASTDGWHVKEFLSELQKDMDGFEKYITEEKTDG